MVAQFLDSAVNLLAQVEAKPELPEPTKAMAMMALLGIALLGMLIVVIILLGGHWVRKIGNYRRGPVVPPDFVLRRDDDDDEPDEPSPAESSRSSSETMLPQDTKNS